jgi:hypothetical protein
VPVAAGTAVPNTVPAAPPTAIPMTQDGEQDPKMPSLPERTKQPTAIDLPEGDPWLGKISIIKDASQANSYILEKPIAVDNTFSIFFSEKDMRTVIAPALELYDKTIKTESSDETKNQQGGEDLSKLLESFKGKEPAKEAEKPLPNIYLGSILYYSPDNWAVWVNGKKLPSHFNNPANVFYVTRISRTEATFAWKPQNFRGMGQLWGEKSARPETTPKNVAVDVSAKTVTLTMHPNQTFIPSTLKIAEGIVFSPAAPAAPAAAGN